MPFIFTSLENMPETPKPEISTRAQHCKDCQGNRGSAVIHQLQSLKDNPGANRVAKDDKTIRVQLLWKGKECLKMSCEKKREKLQWKLWNGAYSSLQLDKDFPNRCGLLQITE